MSNFNSALQYVLTNEKGYVNRSDDRGGPTNFGITMPILAKLLARDVTDQDIQNMSQDQAAQCYLNYFWQPNRLDEVNSAAIATCVFDMIVNQRFGVGVKLAQLAAGFSVTDGIMGDKSLAAINSMTTPDFISHFIVQCMDRYADIVVSDPTELANLKGWLNRVGRMITLM
jgi:lysozyme family protein